MHYIVHERGVTVKQEKLRPIIAQTIKVSAIVVINTAEPSIVILVNDEKLK